MWVVQGEWGCRFGKNGRREQWSTLDLDKRSSWNSRPIRLSFLRVFVHIVHICPVEKR